MKIYTIALSVFLISAFTAAFTQVGVFNNVYTHTNEVQFDLENSSMASVQLEEGEDILSDSDMMNLNPDKGGDISFFGSLSRLYDTIDMALNSDKLIMEFTPQSAKSTIQPFANIISWITKIIYGIGLISFFRRFQIR